MTKFKSIDPALAAECFDYDEQTGELRWKYREGMGKNRNNRFTGKVAGHRHTCTVGKTYVQVRVNNILHYAHRIVWVMKSGPIPDDMEVDHIDGDGTNNRWVNLRLVSKVQNKRNMRRFSTNTSGVTGVHFDKRRNTWYAKVWKNGKTHQLIGGVSFETAVKAREAYNLENNFHPNHGQERPL